MRLYRLVTTQPVAGTLLLASCESDSISNFDHCEAIFVSKLLITGQELNSNTVYANEFIFGIRELFYLAY